MSDSFELNGKTYHLVSAPDCHICGTPTRWVYRNLPTCKSCIDKSKQDVQFGIPPGWGHDALPPRWSDETLAVTSTPEYALIVRDRDSIKALLLLYLVDLIAISTALPLLTVICIIRRQLFDMREIGDKDAGSQSNNQDDGQPDVH